MPPVWRSQIEAHEILRGKGLEVRLSLALSTIQFHSDASLKAVDRRAPNNPKNLRWRTEGDISSRRSTSASCGDESRFSLWDHDGRIRVRRYAGESCLPECVIERHSDLTPGVRFRIMDDPICLTHATSLACLFAGYVAY
ncbi:NACHT and WD repeat domain-containing protein 2 [Trichonephila clavipes]|nr:NACHT and WD repeat domain-containing protein 2 [Trichonephila clavipes]